MKFKKKKGFTLTELIAVIIVLALLITLSIVAFVGIRKNVLKKDYNNLVSYLEAKAAEYANETNITTVSVEELIKQGVVTADDQKAIYNPENKESMNCYIIKSTFKDGKYVAKLAENLGEENGKCNSYIQTNKFEICKYDASSGNCESFRSDFWFKEDITLGIKYSNSNNAINDANALYNWTSTSGTTSNENLITTNTDTVNQNTYKCEVTIGTIKGEASSKINIDKQAPVVEEVNYDTGWAAIKNVVLKANDMGGSGVGGYDVVKDGFECQNYVTNNNFVIKENGSYKYCVIDKAGNVTSNTFTVDKIDNKAPQNLKVEADDGVTSGSWHKRPFNLKFSATGNNVIYYFNTRKYNESYSNNLLLIGLGLNNIESSYNQKIVDVKACNAAGVCSDVVSYEIKYDATAPHYDRGGSIGNGSYSKPIYSDNAGGIGNVTVYTCATTGVPSFGDSCFSSYQTYYSYSCGLTYYLYSYAEDGLGNKSDIMKHNDYYYESCPAPTYDDWDSDDTGTGGSSGGSYCDATCQMKNNSEKWWDIKNDNSIPNDEKQRLLDDLHRDNENISGGNPDCGSGCTYNPGDGTWSDDSGNSLYRPSNGRK